VLPKGRREQINKESRVFLPRRSGHEHLSNHDADADAWSIQMSDQEEHAPSAPVSEIGDDEAGFDAEQASSAQASQDRSN